MFEMFRKKHVVITAPVLKIPVKLVESKPKPQFVEFPSHLVKNTNFNFPHIIKNLQVFWGSPLFHTRVNNLLINDRDVPRQGFPVEIYKELHRLSELHSIVFPELNPKSNDPWHNADLERIQK